MILKQLEKDYKLNENDLFIARYILEHSEEIPLLSSHQLAKETKIIYKKELIKC